jgi:catechol 2,3-dioxygenase-like lactoylglutathione lyase family enzyme
MLRHAALNVEKLEPSRHFYEELLGFRAYHVGDPDWLMLERDGTTLSLVSNHPKHPAHLGFVACSPADVDALYARVIRFAPESRPSEPKLHRDGSYGFYFQDPSGNALEYIFIPALPSRPDQAVPEALAVLLLTAPAFGTQSQEPLIEQTLIEELRLGLRGVPFAVAPLESGNLKIESVLSELLSSDPIALVRVVPCFFADMGFESPVLSDLLKRFQLAHPQARFEMMSALGARSGVRAAIVTAVAESVLYGAGSAGVSRAGVGTVSGG